MEAEMIQDNLQVPERPSLYDRLGGVYNIATVVDNLIDRVMTDPRLNANPRVDEAHHRVTPAGFKFLLRDNQNHARCDNQASLPAVSVVQRKLHPGIMMSGCQAGVKPGPLGPRLWRLRA
jgi:hypothetical protein